MESEMYKEYSFGKRWYNSNGKYHHRENDLPAVEDNDGLKAWYINGKIHREIGPAVIYPNGDERWFLNDIRYFPEEMPMKLYIEYLKWEYKKKNGI